MVMSPPESESVIVFERLTKRFGPTLAVANLDLEVHAGEVFGFIGPNGAGKTTAIRVLLDFLRPSSGAVRVLGLDAREDSLNIRSRTGYLPADLALYEHINAADLLSWLDRLRGRHGLDHGRALAKRLDLDLSRRVGDLSTGNRQKIGVVQAFMHRPELLILDEPTSGLDPLVRQVFRDMVAEAVYEGSTVFLSSHVLSEVEDICDRVGMIVHGELKSIDHIADLRTNAGRHVRATVPAGSNIGALVRLPGVTKVHSIVPCRSGTTEVAFDMAGDLQDLILVLGTLDVSDLIVEPRTLEELFLDRLNPTEAAEAPWAHVQRDACVS